MLGMHHLGYMLGMYHLGYTTYPPWCTYLPTLGIPTIPPWVLVYLVMMYTALGVREERPWAQDGRIPWVRASLLPKES